MSSSDAMARDVTALSNLILEQELSGHRFVGDVVAPITDDLKRLPRLSRHQVVIGWSSVGTALKLLRQFTIY
jgi:hypothetical protein